MSCWFSRGDERAISTATSILFSPDAFANRCAYITAFYHDENEHGVLDRDYPYLTRERMDAFVESAAAEIAGELSAFDIFLA